MFVCQAVLGFRRSAARTALLWLGVLLSAGLLRLLLHWRPDWMLRLSHRRCHLRHASSVLVIVSSATPRTVRTLLIVRAGML